MREALSVAIITGDGSAAVDSTPNTWKIALKLPIQITEFSGVEKAGSNAHQSARTGPLVNQCLSRKATCGQPGRRKRSDRHSQEPGWA